MFTVYSEHGIGPVRGDFTEAEVATLAERHPECIYFEEKVCRLVAGVGWVHVAPYTERLPHGTVVTGCHNCGVRMVD